MSMADNTASQDPVQQSNTASEDIETTPVQLQYPTLDLKTSLESLLCHSTTSSQITISMPRFSAEPSELSDSWASLDDSYYSQDEDLRSDAAETGSLVDLSSNHDTESAAGDDTRSEVNIEDDQVTSMIVQTPSVDHEAETESKEQRAHEGQEEEDMEDTIVLRRSHDEPGSNIIELEYTRNLPSSTMLSPAQSRSPRKETISMTISKKPLHITGRPYRIAYYGAASARATKDELLGKVAAALVAPSSVHASSRSSTVFNIVPTEFGPGSKPAFADLIPSQAQMAVDSLNLATPTPERPYDIGFSIQDGRKFTSELVTPQSLLVSSSDTWRPDFLVVQIGRDDGAADFADVYETLELADRHSWPVVVVASASTVGLEPYRSDWGIKIVHSIDTNDGIQEIMRAIDLDTFLALDTVQLNHHLRYITDLSILQDQHRQAGLSWFSILSDRIRERLNKNYAPSERYVLKAMQNAHVNADDDKIPMNRVRQHLIDAWTSATSADFRQQCSELIAPRMLKDVFLTLIVMLLGVYIVGFSQSFAQMSAPGRNSTTVGAWPRDTMTATATATSPTATISNVSTKSAAPTSVTSVDQDHTFHDPTSFNQVWHKFTGRQSMALDKVFAPEAVEDIKQSESKSIKVEVRKRRDGPTVGEKPILKAEIPKLGSKSLLDTVTRYFNISMPSLLSGNSYAAKHLEWRLKMAQRRAERKADGQRLRAEISQMHQKLTDFWSDVSQQVNDVSKETQEQFTELIDRSKQLMDWADWSRNPLTLTKIADRHKELLSRAQSQAQTLMKEAGPRMVRKKPSVKVFGFNIL